MTKKFFQVLLILSVVLFATSYATSHCEIPCGIYDDEMRFNMMAEHITTIEKSIKQVTKLETGKPINYNQLIRWVMNKDHHANKLQEIVTQYFMTQRIKVDTEKYTDKLITLHKMLVYAMKCKQTTDLSHIRTLRSLLKKFHDLYFGRSHK